MSKLSELLDEINSRPLSDETVQAIGEEVVKEARTPIRIEVKYEGNR